MLPAGLPFVRYFLPACVHPCLAAGFDWDAKDSLYMGTVDYSSVRALHGYNSCGWDDLESLAITLLEMATGG